MIARQTAACAALGCALGLAAANDATACAPETFAVAIDVGHSRADPGAISARGKPEFAFNLRLAQALRAALADQGFSAAFLVETDGAAIALTERTRRAAERGAALFLSIHHDSVQPRYLRPWTPDAPAPEASTTRPFRYADDFRGFSIFISTSGAHPTDSRAVATALADALLAAGLAPTLHHAAPIRGENRTLLDAGRGVYDFPELAVLRTATMPALLFEAGVIVHRDEEALLETAAHRATLVEAMIAAIRVACAD